MLQRAAQWKPLLHLIQKGKGSRDSKNDSLARDFSMYLGRKDYSTIILNDQMQHLLSSARDVLLNSKNGLRHLATMTFGEHSPAAEDLLDRMNQITTYLRSYPPDVRVHTMDSYAETQDPTTIPRHQHLSSIPPWQALSVETRRTLPLEFSLSITLYELFQRSSTTNRNQSLICLFLTITIIHELAHIVMYTFASQDTPVKFYGNVPLKADAEKGEAAASLERVMFGGEVFLATPSSFTIETVDPSHVIILVATESKDNWKVLDKSIANLTDIVSGDWSHISNVPTQPFPSGFSLVKPKSSDVKSSSPPAPSSSYGDYVVWVPPSNIRGVKY
ncbi:uncharacterized protein F5891DRAFT_1015239 [Suillus fuscotomentosus]|uniref:Uncharacterized protein n=1 Tax=Suillus fuscotomentosus TaxID=1912939 RepID=A0AAD4ECN9_9AGAM|nr:uncharacterized protein F5891DRAFT_1015239 [Suillus fuscotomentosus]KAG1903819.1 hypothetical protein F5891DRAFT_1015239 [Suillus fuscotomentosus]